MQRREQMQIGNATSHEYQKNQKEYIPDYCYEIQLVIPMRIEEKYVCMYVRTCVHVHLYNNLYRQLGVYIHACTFTCTHIHM